MPEQSQNQTQNQSQNQFKRHIAFKVKIGDLLIGKPIMTSEGRFNNLELGDKKISRVNIIGNIVDKFENPGSQDAGGGSKYTFFTLDDGSGQIQLKCFGDDVEKFKPIVQGLTVIVIGVLRHWNNETYIQPEIIHETDPKYLLIRKLEIEKNHSEKLSQQPIQKEKIVEVKDKILENIKNAEPDGGIETDNLLKTLQGTSPELVNQEIKKLLEEGMIFEPRPGKLRWLG
ncbi:MAG: OB-fold nucleic acid binding domain-containing protein [Candidatus Nanoarchaeia archaeon]